MNYKFVIFIIFCIALTVSGCGDTSSASSNFTTWTLSDPYNVGGEGTLTLNSTNNGTLNSLYEANNKISTLSLNSSEVELRYGRDENGNIVSGKFTSQTDSIDLSR